MLALGLLGRIWLSWSLLGAAGNAGRASLLRIWFGSGWGGEDWALSVQGLRRSPAGVRWREEERRLGFLGLSSTFSLLL